MTDTTKNTHSVRKMAELDIGREFTCRDLMSVLVKDEDYGACGTGPVRLNRSRSSVVVPLAAIVRSISIGSRALSRAVLMMVMGIETLFWPCFVIFPKVVLRKNTAFLSCLSAKLLVGLTEEDIKRIFDPHYTTKIDGHGLGLAICHSIVKKHQGRIQVSSENDKCTKFEIFLPII